MLDSCLIQSLLWLPLVLAFCPRLFCLAYIQSPTLCIEGLSANTSRFCTQLVDYTLPEELSHGPYVKVHGTPLHVAHLDLANGPQLVLQEGESTACAIILGCGTGIRFSNTCNVNRAVVFAMQGQP